MSREAEGERRTAGTSGDASPPDGPRAGVSALLLDLARAEPDPDGSWERVARPGAVIGRFELLRELGRGGFGVVFEARDRELGRLVAFKAVRPGSRASSAQRVEWLRREAEATAQLSHENIVALHDAGRSEHGPYLVFELLDGQTLSERLERGPLQPREAICVAVAVARALAYAHAAGVLHRDLKPSNVILTSRGQVKVLDFGLAHVFGWTGPVSGGTPAYMAPEQWRGGTEDARTDVFALGVMLYEMVTGRLPFAIRDGRSGAVDPDVPPPALEALPSRLRPVVASAISPDPEARPRNAEVFLEQLVAVEGALAERARSGWRGRSTAAAVGALVACVLALGVWRLARPSRPSPPGPAAAEAQGTTTNLDAYAHYFRARDAADDWRLEETAAELERALALDPEFALAYYFRAYLDEFLGVPLPTRRAHVEAALRFSERLPPKERLLVQAWGAHVRGDDAGAGRVYRTAVEAFSEDPDVLFLAGDFLFHAGDLERAAGLFQRAMEARPGWRPPLGHLAETFDGLGRLDQVLGPLRRAVASAPNAATYAALGDAYLALGEAEEAVRALRAAMAAGGGPNTVQALGDVLLRASRFDEAEAEGRRLIEPGIPPRLQLAGHHLLAVARAFQGRHRDALHLLDQIPAAVRAASPGRAQAVAVVVLTVSAADPGRLRLEARGWGNHAAFYLAYAGDLAHASELAPGLSGPDLDLYEGLVAWRRGHRDTAVGRLRSATRQGANMRHLGRLVLAEVLSEMGRDDEALEALRASRLSTTATQTLLYPRTLLVAARSLERLGRRDEARARIDELLALWKDADADLPDLAEARALRARLQR